MKTGNSVSIWDLFLSAILLLITANAQASLQSSFKADGLGFVSENFSNTPSSSFSLVGVNLRSVHSENDFLKVNVSGAYAVGYPTMSFMNIKEFFINTKFESSGEIQSQILFGRRLHLWSDADQEWNLGSFQPQFRWNPVNPSQQGLTGLFWQMKSSSWGFLVFGSPVFIPDQGASYELKNGQFQNTSPWFKNPPQNLHFYGENLPIEYDVQAPPLSDIVYQQSYGFQFEIQGNLGFYSRLSGQYRPSNQMALGYQANVISAVSVQVEVQPKTYYENVVGLDFGFKNNNHHAYLSLIQNRPQDVDFATDFTKPIIKESNIIATGYSYQTHLQKFDLNTKVSYLKIIGEDVKDQGGDASEARGSLSWKYLYTEAARASLGAKYFATKNLSLTSELGWTQGISTQYKQLDFSNRIDFRGPWSINLDLYFTSSEDEKSPTFVFKDLDQVWLGVGYEF